MEEEEAQENNEIVVQDLKSVNEIENLEGKVETSETKQSDSGDRSSVDLGSNGNLQGVERVTTDKDGDLFEQVSLKDAVNIDEKFDGDHVDLNQPGRSDNVQQLSASYNDTSDYSLEKVPSGFNSPSNPDINHDHDPVVPEPDRRSVDYVGLNVSSSSLDSALDLYGAGGYSPVTSPQKTKLKPTAPNVSPELLHLIDSAIMGKPESMDHLKHIVSGVEHFGNGEELAESIAFLVVDSLLGTMGGVESFEEDEDDNPPSVMLNCRAAIVAGELIPWLPCVEKHGGLMSARTRMVRGLLVILRACTRNRAMCSTAGLLGVLLRSAENIFVQDSGVPEQQSWDGVPLCYCIQYLAGHSLSVIDLHRWFGVISKTLTTKWAGRLMLSL